MPASMIAQLEMALAFAPSPLATARRTLADATASYWQALETCDRTHPVAWRGTEHPCCVTTFVAWLKRCDAYKAFVLCEFAGARAW